MPAQVRSVPRNDHDMGGAHRDLLLATGADIGLPRLRRVDPAYVEAESLAGSGQVGDLLQFLHLERRYRTAPAATTSRGGTSHG